MAIQDRDRKILWGRSGNRCAICRRVLVAAGAAPDRDSVTGEEAHIVARSTSGPRGAQPDVVDRDAYDNLVLLCSIHHKVVDDQPHRYSPARLREIKADHEEWVRRSLEPPTAIGPRLVDLPMLPARLVNRDREIAAITAVMERADETPLPSVVVLTGMHGVGKSAVGAHWVMRNWARFEGGQLVGDFSRRRHAGPVDVGEVLADFLRDLGMSSDAIPATLADRRRLFLERTMARKVVMLLDDVDHAAQVSAVMPAAGGSVVLVTSNYHLDELLFEGAALVPLDPLDEETSRRLLVDMLGRERVGEDPDAVDRLVAMCGGLPLALRVCGGRLVGRYRRRGIAALVAGISSAANRLDALSGPGGYAIDAIFDFAYGDLSPEVRLVYRRIGLHPGGEITSAAVSALCDMPVSDAEAALDALYDAHLLEGGAHGGYRIHELVGYHARACAERDDSPAERDRAVRNLVDWYYAVLQAADRAVSEDRLRLDARDIRSEFRLPVFAAARDAFQWFDRERETVEAVLQLAVEISHDERIWQLAEALWLFCYNRKLYSLWFAACDAGSQAAQRLGDAAVEARMRSCLARAYSDQGDFGRAASEMRAADAAAAHTDNDELRASVTEFGAVVRFERGDLADALSRFTRARELFERCMRPRGVAIQEYQIGKCLIAMGASERALEPLASAVSRFAALGDEVLVGRATRRRGEALSGLGRTHEARAALQTALEIAERVDVRFDAAQALEGLAGVSDAEGDPDAARVYRDHAFRLYHEMGHPREKSMFGDRGEVAPS